MREVFTCILHARIVIINSESSKRSEALARFEHLFIQIMQVSHAETLYFSPPLSIKCIVDRISFKSTEFPMLGTLQLSFEAAFRFVRMHPGCGMDASAFTLKTVKTSWLNHLHLSRNHATYTALNPSCRLASHSSEFLSHGPKVSFSSTISVVFIIGRIRSSLRVLPVLSLGQWLGSSLLASRAEFLLLLLRNNVDRLWKNAAESKRRKGFEFWKELKGWEARRGLGSGCLCG